MIHLAQILLLFSTTFSLVTCSGTKQASTNLPIAEKVDLSNPNLQKAYFASGCFWCVEAVFESVIGVKEVISGYAGGSAETAHYEMVGSGSTGHAESVEVYYDPSQVSYQILLEVFFTSHDATTLNRQGPDAGTQYRSAIFYQNEGEKSSAEKYIAQLESSIYKKGEITTDITPFIAFYPAEEYHQDYEKRNPNQPYVRSVSIPRLNKFKAARPDLLKPEAKLSH